MYDLNAYAESIMPIVDNSTWLFRKVLDYDKEGKVLKPVSIDVKNSNRLWDKAQRRVVELLVSTKDSHDGLANYKSLCLRRILDGIAYQMLGLRTHLVKRLDSHGLPQNIDFTILPKTMRYANRMNSSSRMSFSLVADLTTFIHTCDILEDDWRRSNNERLKFIELKTGKVNASLAPYVEQTSPTLDSLSEIPDAIPDVHMKQYKRMVRQKIRKHQAESIVRSDDRDDIVLDITKPLESSSKVTLVSGKHQASSDFGYVINALCSSILDDSESTFSLSHQNCLHIGAGYGNNYSEAYERAKYAAHSAYKRYKECETLESGHRREEINNLIGEDSDLIEAPLFAWNWPGGTTTPFTLWDVERSVLRKFISGNMEVVVIFDLPSFITLAAQHGQHFYLSSRKYGEKYKASCCPKWAKRVLMKQLDGGITSALGSGQMKRMLADLNNPLYVLQLEKDFDEYLLRVNREKN